VVEHRSIPDSLQQRVVAAHGDAGIVELVALCGLYAVMGYMVTAFDIPIEAGFPPPPGQAQSS
jgi:4-carboxymuconolactone decarboxylase